MKGKIFISYKRNDSGGSTGRINDRLKEHFSPERIFMDIDAIRLAQDFVKVIERDVNDCDILLAIIGQNWLKITDKNGNTLFNNPNDWVRIEIKTALQRNIPVVPIIVDNGTMPDHSELPEDIKALASRHAMEIRHNRFDADIAQLIKDLQSILDDISRADTAAEERVKAKLAEEKRAKDAKEMLKVKQLAETAKIKAEERTKLALVEEEKRKSAGTLIKTENQSAETYKKASSQIQPAVYSQKKKDDEPPYLFKISLLLVSSFIIAFILAIVVRFFMDPNNISVGTIFGSKVYWICFAISFVFCTYAYSEQD